MKPKAERRSPASRLIDWRIRDLGGWRGETLARMRRLVLDLAGSIPTRFRQVRAVGD